MAGHSKWANIKHKKGAADAKRGKIFTKLIKEITVAARMGGGDPGSNPRLRTALIACKAANMPKDNIDRAIKKGTGDLGGQVFEEVSYEGYGPHGVAIIIEALTDNKNRTLPEIRTIMNKNGGKLGEKGSVGWMFEQKGVIIVSDEGVEEEELMDFALEAGAEDIVKHDGIYEITTDPKEYLSVAEVFDNQDKYKVEVSELSLIPSTTVELNAAGVEQIERLIGVIEDCDDVQKVYANHELKE